MEGIVKLPSRLAIRRTRAARVNAFIVFMGSVGRRFWAAEQPQPGRRFEHRLRLQTDRPFGRIEVDDRARPWWLCPYSSRRIYLLNPRHVPHVGGGTLKELLLALTGYVMRGDQLHPRALGPWPTWVCGDGDRWRYGLDTMASVRAFARGLGILAPQPDTVHLQVDVDEFTAEWLDEAGMSLRAADQGSRKGAQPVSRGEVCERLAAGAALELASGISRAATRALLGEAVASAGIEKIEAARKVAADPLDPAEEAIPAHAAVEEERGPLVQDPDPFVYLCGECSGPAWSAAPHHCPGPDRSWP